MIEYQWCSPLGNPDWQLYTPPGWTITNFLGASYYLYTNAGKKLTRHTGEDFNMPGKADIGQAVHAIRSGVIIYAGDGGGTWLGVVVIRHDCDNGFVIARYAHLNPKTLLVKAQDTVYTGQQLGVIVDPRYRAGFEAHFHFDIGKENDLFLEQNPLNWPGNNLEKIKRYYQSPSVYLKPKLDESIYADYYWTTEPLNVREDAGVKSVKRTTLPKNTPVLLSSVEKKMTSDLRHWAMIDKCPLANAIGGWCSIEYLEQR